MRGNPHHGGDLVRRRWSIPAYAGEPYTDGWAELHNRVYPRVCGGTHREPIYKPPTWGLSPRMRGNLPQYHNGDAQPGSIPAYAGEPTADDGGTQAHRVYPRVCGGTRKG